MNPVIPFAFWLERLSAPLPALPAPAPGVGRVGIYAASRPAHLRHALEFFARFAPEVEIAVALPDGALPPEWAGVDPAAMAAGVHAKVTVGRVPGAFESELARCDASLLLFEWPPRAGGYGAAERRALGRLQRRLNPQRSVLVDGVGQVWDASPAARLARRLAGPLARRIVPMANRAVTRSLGRQALPDLGADAQRAAGACEHRRRRRLINAPRPIDQCLDCRVGLTPPDWLESARYRELYGHQYHVRWIVAERVEDPLPFTIFPQCRLNNMERAGIARASIAGVRALDFGCGPGGLCGALLDLGAREVTGCDMAPESLDTARQRYPAARFVEADDRLAGLDGPYDLAILAHALEHVPDPLAVLQRLKDRLAPGGRLYIEVPWADAFTWNGPMNGWRILEHLWEFNKTSLARLVTAAGFDDVRVVDTVEATGGVERFLACSARRG